MKLKKCPFCGGEARYIDGYYDGWNEYNYPMVCCMSCGASVPTRDKTASKAWNRRK